MPFTRGQWTQTGSGTLSASQWHVGEAGAGGVAPYDGLLNSGGTVTAFTAPQIGMRLGQARLQSGGVQSPFIQWDSAVYDSVNRQFVFTLWGGDQGESSNEVNVFDMATGTWNPSGRPYHPTTRLMVANGVTWPTAFTPYQSATQGPAGVKDVNGYYTAGIKLSTGSALRTVPLGRHTYGGMCYMPSVQRVWYWGTFADWASGTSCFIMSEWDTVTNQWQMIDGADGNAFGGGAFHDTSNTFVAAACWDSINNRVIFTNGQGLWAYNPAAAAGSRTTWLRNDATLSNSLGNSHMVFDPVRNHAFLLGAPTASTFIELDLNVGTPTRTVKTITGATWTTASGSSGAGFGPGALYDPVSDRFIIWIGGKTLYSVHPVSYFSEAFGSTSGDDPGTPTVGIWARFAYDGVTDTYVTINNATQTGAFVFAPARAAPSISFTDMASVMRNGNTDTSQGQASGVNGAIVTLWGMNIGNSQDTSTITIGGVNVPTVYYWGQALPPYSPANLSNAYQRMQCVIFQVPVTCPTGSQNIVITVAGQVSNSFPVTVRTTGNCYYIKTTGNNTTGNGSFSQPWLTVAKALTIMVSGDICYVGNAVSTPLGIEMPALGAITTPLTLVAYPGADCQVGDASHNAFLYSSSAAGVNITYSKFNVMGLDQAVTLLDKCRLVGCKIQAPSGQGSLGTVGQNPFRTAQDIYVYGNEFTNCGINDPAGFDAQYHVLYFSGNRNATIPIVEYNRVAGWNYFHDNLASRAINCFNGNALGTINDALSGFVINDNVILNQEQDGILIGNGIVGDNYVYNNLVMNVGLSSQGRVTDPHSGLDVQTGDPPGIVSGLPPVIHCYNNTFINCGSVAASNSGILHLRGTATSYDMYNNIFYQASGLPYVGSATTAPPLSGQSHNNCWFGAGVPPVWEIGGLNVNPQLVANSAPFDPHLRATSPCIGAGTTPGVPSLDFDGIARPPAGAWDIGAHQFFTTAVPPPTTLGLSPSTKNPGDSGFTLSVSGANFQVGAVVKWAGSSRTTTFVNSGLLTAAILTSDLVASGMFAVTVVNPGNITSNSQAFSVAQPPGTIEIVFDGLLRDRVGQTNTALAPDGALDGVVTVTLGATAGKTVTSLRQDVHDANDASIGIWDTDNGNGFWVLGVATGLDSAYLNNASTMAVSFFVADGGSFKTFASDASGIEYLDGNTLRITAGFSDGTSATDIITINPPIPPPPTDQGFNTQTAFMYGQGL